MDLGLNGRTAIVCASSHGLGRACAGGCECCSGYRSLADCAGSQCDRTGGAKAGDGVLDDGDRTPEADLERGARVGEVKFGQRLRCEGVARGEDEVVEFSGPFQHGHDLRLIPDVDGAADAPVGQLVQRRFDALPVG